MCSLSNTSATDRETGTNNSQQVEGTDQELHQHQIDMAPKLTAPSKENPTKFSAPSRFDQLFEANLGSYKSLASDVRVEGADIASMVSKSNEVVQRLRPWNQVPESGRNVPHIPFKVNSELWPLCEPGSILFFDPEYADIATGALALIEFPARSGQEESWIAPSFLYGTHKSWKVTPPYGDGFLEFNHANLLGICVGYLTLLDNGVRYLARGRECDAFQPLWFPGHEPTDCGLVGLDATIRTSR